MIFTAQNISLQLSGLPQKSTENRHILAPHDDRIKGIILNVLVGYTLSFGKSENI
jgi:hypothetical protein